MHPDTERVYSELVEGGVSLATGDKIILSQALEAMETALQNHGEQYFIAHPEMDEAPYRVFLERDPLTGKLLFYVAVGNASIHEGVRSAIAQIMEGQMTRNIVKNEQCDDLHDGQG